MSNNIINTDDPRETYYALCLWFASFISFNHWVSRNFVVGGQDICWPYFMGCQPVLHFISPYYYAFIYILLLLVPILYVKAYFKTAFVLACIVFFIKFISAFILSYSIPTEFMHFLLAMIFAYLFLPEKIKTAMVLIAALYFSSAAVKFTDSWIAAKYFTTIDFNTWLAKSLWLPIATNFVIALEVLCPILLLNKKFRIRQFALFIFLCFHCASVLLVGFHFSAFSLLPLLVLFLNNQRSTFSLNRYSFLFILFILMLHNYPKFFIAENRYTLRTQKMALSMIDYNYQCLSKYKVINEESGLIISQHEWGSDQASLKCGPYSQWFRLQTVCRSLAPNQTISWDFYQSTNGSPFYQLVHSINPCRVSYYFFRDNFWITTPESSSAHIGYPQLSKPPLASNVETPKIASTSQITIPTWQRILIDYLSTFVFLWNALWFVVLFCFLYMIFPNSKAKKSAASS